MYVYVQVEQMIVLVASVLMGLLVVVVSTANTLFVAKLLITLDVIAVYLIGI